jgi:hypothetical protein
MVKHMNLCVPARRCVRRLPACLSPQMCTRYVCANIPCVCQHACVCQGFPPVLVRKCAPVMCVPIYHVCASTPVCVGTPVCAKAPTTPLRQPCTQLFWAPEVKTLGDIFSYEVYHVWKHGFILSYHMWSSTLGLGKFNLFTQTQHRMLCRCVCQGSPPVQVRKCAPNFFY